MASTRQFASGATRDQDMTKLDYHGFTSPLVKKRFGLYMTKHRIQSDGTVRASDNWKLGIPRNAYIKSADRHMEDWKLHHDGFGMEAVETLEDSLCALIFNAQGYLHSLLLEKLTRKPKLSLDAVVISGVASSRQAPTDVQLVEPALPG